jgi:hypothetical protein
LKDANQDGTSGLPVDPGDDGHAEMQLMHSQLIPGNEWLSTDFDMLNLKLPFY